jgi:crotonobetainyl-CoA:carnitine CoA-transferase CaiB-like acyl-CoA transferase
MAAVLMSINERIHYDLSEDDLGAEVPILGATDCPFFTSPDGVEFVAPMSLVGSLSFPFYLHAMRRPDLADDPRFLTPELRAQNLNALHAVVQAWIDTFDSMASLDAQLDEAKVATGRVRDVAEFNDTDWAKSWVTTREVSDRHGGIITIPAPPWHFSAHDGSLTDQLPAHQGEHNEEILRELHLTDDDIKALRDSGALVDSPNASSAG